VCVCVCVCVCVYLLPTNTVALLSGMVKNENMMPEL